MKEGSGGERGIRTLDTVSRIHAFQACAFNHSATSPQGQWTLILIARGSSSRIGGECQDGCIRSSQISAHARIKVRFCETQGGTDANLGPPVDQKRVS